MKVKTTPITQSQRVECRLWKLSIDDIPIIKIVVLSRLLFDLRVNDTVVSVAIVSQFSADLFLNSYFLT